METFVAPEKLSRGMRRNGVMICAFFGLGWFFGGAGILGDGPRYWVAFALAVAVSAGLAVATGLVESRRERPRELPKDWGRRYGIWVGVEVVLIVAAVFLYASLDLIAFLPGTVAVIVGAHFIPLARAFDEPKYKPAGYAVILAGVGGIVGGFSGVELGGAIAGFGTAVALWATGYAVLTRG